jgi:predicted Zn-dependent peptidase
VIRQTRLENGLTLLAEEMSDVRSVAVGIWLRQGSRHEPGDAGGISHFIEHLVFKGTATRSAAQLAREIDAIGGQMDAFTTKEYTCFYFRVLDEHLDLAFDLLADIIRHPRFGSEDIEKEREVIREEIRMVDDSPEETLYDLIHAERWKGHPLGLPVQGTMATVGRMGRAALLDHFSRVYVPSAMVLTAAGRLDAARVEEAAAASFGRMPPGSPPHDGASPPTDRGGLVVREKREMEQVHLGLALGGIPEGHDDRYALMILNNILGGGMSSRLFQKVREERGLVYAIQASTNGYSDGGFQMVYAAAKPASAAEVVDLVCAELRALKQSPVDATEVEHSRQNLKGNLLLSLESSTSRMSSLARKEIVFGRQVSQEEILAGLDAVTPDHVLRLAKETFRAGDATLAIHGPVHELPPLDARLDF